ncbi:hypothetical protein [Chthonobacter albigriseus]|uniref:hypothetical protein n=1 Tax=Chthonobacter albigriseus TaxID=1683161 RepID=UPI0015EF1C5F|nr:hypothetical protein [Chthonobacter albigriseus]
MARTGDRSDDLTATGFLDALVFMAFVVLGAGYILGAKTADLPPAWVTFVPVAIMVGYALTTRLARGLLLRDDQTGDNLYYMGFLFTLTSLGVSLWQFSVSGAAEAIVRNFGIAIATTIAGIALRLFMNQMRRDPADIERVSRLELADAARRVRRELDSTVVEMNQFRRAQLQSMRDGADDGRKLADETMKLAETVADAARRLDAPVETRAKALEELLDRFADRLADHARSMDRLSAALREAQGTLRAGTADRCEREDV